MQIFFSFVLFQFSFEIIIACNLRHREGILTNPNCLYALITPNQLLKSHGKCMQIRGTRILYNFILDENKQLKYYINKALKCFSNCFFVNETRNYFNVCNNSLLFNLRRNILSGNTRCQVVFVASRL